jgi:hypothetical protein
MAYSISPMLRSLLSRLVSAEEQGICKLRNIVNHNLLNKNKHNNVLKILPRKIKILQPRWLWDTNNIHISRFSGSLNVEDNS